MHEAMERWARKGDRPVTLASGMRVRLRVRSAVELIRRGMMPQELRARATQYETGGWDPAKLSEEERLQTYDFMRTFIARSIVGIEADDGSGWTEVQALDATDIADLPEPDLQGIQDIVTLRKSPLQVTAESERALGIIDLVPPRDLEGEAARTTTGWSEFRNGAGAPAAGADGAAVREVAGAGLPSDR